MTEEENDKFRKNKTSGKILKAQNMDSVVSGNAENEVVDVVTSATIKDQNASIEDRLNQIKWILKKSSKPLSAEDICEKISREEKKFTIVQVNKLMRSLKTFTPLKREIILGVPYFSLLDKD